MKGADAETELSHAEHSLNILGGKLNAFHQFELNGCGERAVIEISKTNPTPVKYPRNSAQIKKNPL